MITRQQFIANAMVKEYALNGASLLWHALNEAFCSPASWYCQSDRSDIDWYCLEPVDEDKTHCDDCHEIIQAEAAEARNDTFWREHGCSESELHARELRYRDASYMASVRVN